MLFRSVGNFLGSDIIGEGRISVEVAVPEFWLRHSLQDSNDRYTTVISIWIISVYLGHQIDLSKA